MTLTELSRLADAELARLGVLFDARDNPDGLAPVLALAQLNRESEAGGTRKPSPTR